MTEISITIDDPDIVANLSFLEKISPLFTPQRIVCASLSRILQEAVRHQKNRTIQDYRIGVITEERYIELIGKPPSDELKKEAKDIKTRDTRIRYATGEIDADEYETIMKEPPTQELKSKRINMRSYLDDLTTFARQGAHMFSEREVEQLFWKAFGQGSAKEDGTGPLAKDFSA